MGKRLALLFDTTALPSPQQAASDMAMEDKREHERRRVLKGGKIVFNGGRSAIDCTIKNLSAGGATLQVESPLGIPDTFELVVHQDNTIKSCRMAWKKENLIGVAFQKTS